MDTRICIPIPTTIDLPYNQRSWKSYAAAISDAGAIPVELDLRLSAKALEALADSCDGFLLPGSPADVEPELYGTPRIESCGPADPLRERADFLLLDHAARTGKPLLGICYGCQSMNVFYGGTLIQDLSPLPVNHAAGSKVAIAHSARINRESLLGELLLGDADAAAEAGDRSARDEGPAALRLPMNTSHHQSVAVAGAGLRIVAYCPDDEVIEAIEPKPGVSLQPMFHVEHSTSAVLRVSGGEGALFHVEHPSRFLLGVQWHPERSTAISAASRAIFRRFVAEAKLYRERPHAGQRGQTTHAGA
jgi:putative glutamine amidotransferase